MAREAQAGEKKEVMARRFVSFEQRIGRALVIVGTISGLRSQSLEKQGEKKNHD